MKILRCAGALALALFLCAPSVAENVVGREIFAPAGSVPSTAIFCDNGSGVAIACNFAVQEAFQLVANNVPSAAQTLFGGDYILEQTCTGYGTLTLQRLGPDGSTYLTMATKSVSDTTTGTGFALGSNAKVRVTVTGTTGCYATFARVPS